MATHCASKKHRVTVVGSGNWGSTIAKIVAENTVENPELFEPEVQMWVFEEDVVLPKDFRDIGGEKHKLTSVINKYHENTKYLPGIKLPANLIANPSIENAVQDASILIFNLPHQFIDKLSAQMKGHILPYARGISCIKGVDVADGKISLFSESIARHLGIYCGALSGANIASEVAEEKWSETTVAYDPPSIDMPNDSSKPHLDAQGKPSSIQLTPLPAEYPPLEHAVFKTLFHRPYFHVRLVSDVAGVSLGGALKNIVALAAGFVDGRGWGDNAKAAVMRVGLLEMVKFGKEFFPTVNAGTFTEESAGVADLITSCSGGRNFRCARLAVQRGVSVAEVEQTELNGQKLQGMSTAKEVNLYLKMRGQEAEYPLFSAVYHILEGNHTVDDIPELVAKADE